ncbi:MAG TPA: hypothetical protein PKB07_01780 [Flavilitoribacter sp.]|nr:hypothetical protein [Flavilitoribacter sp.]
MNKSKFLTYFKALDPSEHQAFKNYIQSRRLKNNALLIRTTESCIQHYPFDDPEPFPEELIFRKLLKADRDKNPAATRQKLYDLRARMLTLLTDYLIQKELENRPEMQDKLLLDALSKRSAYAVFAGKAEEIIRETEGLPAPESGDFQMLSETRQVLFFHPHTDKFKPDESLLEKAGQNLDQYYLLSKLKLVSEQIIRSQIYSTGKQSEIPEEITVLMEKHADPVLRVYFEVLQMLRLEEPGNLFEKILGDLERHSEKFSRKQLSSLYHKLLYRANYFYEENRLQYLKYILDVFKLADRLGILAIENSISHILFVNITAVASALEGRSAWLNTFRKKYEACLETEEKKYAVPLAEAYVLFSIGEPDQALAMLENASKSHPADRLQVESLYIRIYLDLLRRDQDTVEELENAISRFHGFLDRDTRISGRKKTAVSHFIRIVQLIARYYTSPQSERTAERRAAISEQYARMTPMYSAQWVSQKIKEIGE